MRAPAKLLAVLVVFGAASEIGARVVVGKLRPSGVLESAAPHAAGLGPGGDGILGEADGREHLHAGDPSLPGFLLRKAPAWTLTA